MRSRLIIFWLAVPGLIVAFHLWIGRHWQMNDRIARLCDEGGRAAGSRKWDQAETSYQAAMAMFSDKDRASEAFLSVAAKLAHAQSRNGKIVEAVQALNQIVESTTQSSDRSVAQSATVRREAANLNYDIAWLMRRNGAPDTDWTPYAQAARQNLLAIRSDGNKAVDVSDNLERIASFEATSDQIIRDRAFYDQDLAVSFRSPTAQERNEPSPPSPSSKVIPNMGNSGSSSGGGPPRPPVKSGS